jgi:hypothetical protein
MLALERSVHVTAEAVVEQIGTRFPDNKAPVSNAGPDGENRADEPAPRAAGRGGR